MIDHSLLHPTMTACIKPYSIFQALDMLVDSDVKICVVIGFPHGSSTTAVKVHEAVEAVQAGAQDFDMVVNLGKVLSGNLDIC